MSGGCSQLELLTIAHSALMCCHDPWCGPSDCPGRRGEIPLHSEVQHGVAGPPACHFSLLPQPSPPNLGFCAQLLSEVRGELLWGDPRWYPVPITRALESPVVLAAGLILLCSLGCHFLCFFSFTLCGPGWSHLSLLMTAHRPLCPLVSYKRSSPNSFWLSVCTLPHEVRTQTLCSYTPGSRHLPLRGGTFSVVLPSLF